MKDEEKKQAWYAFLMGPIAISVNNTDFIKYYKKLSYYILLEIIIILLIPIGLTFYLSYAGFYLWSDILAWLSLVIIVFYACYVNKKVYSNIKAGKKSSLLILCKNC